MLEIKFNCGTSVGLTKCLCFGLFFIVGIGKLALIIPWVVLQELDNLKKGKMLVHVRQKAVPAVQFIYASLKNQDPKLWGQSMQLASQKICKICSQFGLEYLILM